MTVYRRTVALFDWPEDIPLGELCEWFPRAMSAANATPAVASIGDGHGKRIRRFRIGKKNSISDALKYFTDGYSVTFVNPVGGNYWSCTSAVTISDAMDTRKIELSITTDKMTHQDAISAIEIITRHVSPAYGFVLMNAEMDSVYFVGGISKIGDIAEKQESTEIFCDGIRLSKQHAAGRIHSVFPVNVLSLAHLVEVVDGKSFADWITSSGMGELRRSGPHTYLWIVPEEHRQTATDALERNGLLFVDRAAWAARAVM